VVVLGSASEQEVHHTFERMAADYGNGGDARFVLRYDEGLAHRYAKLSDFCGIATRETVTDSGNAFGLHVHAFLSRPVNARA
jgi:hypothetical protein